MAEWIPDVGPVMGGLHMPVEVCLNSWGSPVEFIQCEALRDLADNKVFVSFARGSEEKIAHPSLGNNVYFSA